MDLTDFYGDAKDVVGDLTSGKPNLMKLLSDAEGAFSDLTKARTDCTLSLEQPDYTEMTPVGEPFEEITERVLAIRKTPARSTSKGGYGGKTKTKTTTKTTTKGGLDDRRTTTTTTTTTKSKGKTTGKHTHKGKTTTTTTTTKGKYGGDRGKTRASNSNHTHKTTTTTTTTTRAGPSERSERDMHDHPH